MPINPSPATIKCPECGHEFDISDVLYNQVEHELKQQFETQLKQERDKFRAESEKIRRQGEQLEKDRAEQRFDGVDALIAQIHADSARARAILSADAS